jgi:hypothetical protein
MTLFQVKLLYSVECYGWMIIFGGYEIIRGKSRCFFKVITRHSTGGTWKNMTISLEGSEPRPGLEVATSIEQVGTLGVLFEPSCPLISVCGGGNFTNE